MKLKELVDGKTLECILRPDPFILDKIGEKASKNPEQGLFMIHKAAVTALFASMMGYLQNRHPSAYVALVAELEQRGANAEIDICGLEEKVPLMRPANHLLGMYESTRPTAAQERFGIDLKVEFEGRTVYEFRTAVDLGRNWPYLAGKRPRPIP